MAFLFIAGGLLLLIIGAEALVRGSSRLAAAIGISPLIIGLTVVAFGTSSPELAVSIQAAVTGQADIALGNVVGSNIFNVLFILGISAMIVPLKVSRQLIRLDVPLLIAISMFVFLLGMDAKIGRRDGLLLFAGLIIYTGLQVYLSRTKGTADVGEIVPGIIEQADPRPRQWLRNTLFIVGGLALLVAGSRWLVNGAVSVARYLGMSELVIGLTIIAAGTSLPEVVTSIIASIRGERDIAVGNVVGSNLFNLLGVLGLTCIVAPSPLAVPPDALWFDLPIMIAVAFACLPVFFSNGIIARWEGAVFFGYYIAYTSYLILATTQFHVLPMLGAAMLYFVIPLTALTLLVTATRSLRKRPKTDTP